MNHRKKPLWRRLEEPVPSVVEGTPAAPVLPTLFWPFRHRRPSYAAALIDGKIKSSETRRPKTHLVVVVRGKPGFW